MNLSFSSIEGYFVTKDEYDGINQILMENGKVFQKLFWLGALLYIGTRKAAIPYCAAFESSNWYSTILTFLPSLSINKYFPLIDWCKLQEIIN